MTPSHDALVFTPDDVDLSRSPLAGKIDAETYVLGAFNPGMTRLPNGNLLLMVRVAGHCASRSATATSTRSAGPRTAITSTPGRWRWSTPPTRASS